MLWRRERSIGLVCKHRLFCWLLPFVSHWTRTVYLHKRRTKPSLFRYPSISGICRMSTRTWDLLPFNLYSTTLCLVFHSARLVVDLKVWLLCHVSRAPSVEIHLKRMRTLPKHPHHRYIDLRKAIVTTSAFTKSSIIFNFYNTPPISIGICVV